VDIFGKRFQKELDSLKMELAELRRSPQSGASTPPAIVPHKDISSLSLKGEISDKVMQ